jgi:putative ABC transport system permease protein
MIRNYLKIALRNLIKHKGYTAINIAGLSFGMASVVMIALFIIRESRVDTFHADRDRIYRLIRIGQAESGSYPIGVTSAPFAPAMKTDFPQDVEETCRVLPNDGVVAYGDRSFKEKRFYFADPNFFQFFSFPLLTGDRSTVLNDVNSVVISEEMAKKYFGDADPLGKILRVDDEWEFKVSGIFRKTDLSHLNFDFMANLEVLRQMSWFTQWWSNSLYTYLRFAPGFDVTAFEKKLPAFMDKYFGEDFKRTGNRTDLTLENLEDIYLKNDTRFDFVEHGDRQALTIFAGVSVLILLIACVNFMNLSTGRSIGRSKEVGLRKVMGAYRSNLIGQFLGESILITMTAMIVAILLVEIGLRPLNAFLGRDLSLLDGGWMIPAGLVTLTLMVGIVAGSYPAFFLSAFQPVTVLKGQGGGVQRKSFIWKALVVFQFSISILLVIGTLIMREQSDFMQNKDLGFDKEQVALVPLDNRVIRENREAFKRQVVQLPGVMQASMMSGEPGGFHDRFSFDIRGQSGDSRRMRTVFTDFDYLRTFGIKIVAGRDFSKDFGTDGGAMLLNEAAVRFLGWTPETALGQRIFINLRDEPERTVIGVVDDFHFLSLHEAIEPLAISVADDHRVMAVKLSGSDLTGTLQEIEKVYARFAPRFPFEYKFLDDAFELLYRREAKLRQLIAVFSFLAIGIACLGLLGLAAFSAEKRTKELGIRKVLGATMPQLVGQFSKEFLWLVLAANGAAVPVAYFMMRAWLDNFAYRVGMTPSAFIVAGGSALVVALVTVSYHAVRSSHTNPVQSLRYE